MKRFALLAALGFGACFSPTYNNPQCGPAGECPLGFTCEQGVCRQDDEPIDARSDGPTDGPDLDAETDGPDEEIDAPPGPMCPTGSTASPDDPNRCFLLTGSANDWNSVRAECLELGGDLADVRSDAENQVVSNVAGQDVWIGASDEQEEGQWVWADGTPIDSVFTSWAPGEPMDPFFHMYNCMAASAAQWFDEMCSENYLGVCRVPAI